MAYMLARTGSFLGLEYLDMITTMVCLEMPFVGVLCHVGTGQLVCLAGYLAVFCMMGSFAKGNFQTEYCLFRNAFQCRLLSCSGQSIGLCYWSVDWFLMIGVFTESFFSKQTYQLFLLVSSTHTHIHWVFTMFSVHIVHICYD